MIKPDPLIYKSLSGRPKITLEAWLELAPLFLESLRTESTDLAALKARWVKADVGDAVPYSVVKKLDDDDVLFIIPPRAWSESAEIDISGRVLLANKIGRNTNGAVRRKFLQDALGSVKFSGTLPEELLNEWREIEKITSSYLKPNSGKTEEVIEKAKDYIDEGQDEWG